MCPGQCGFILLCCQADKDMSVLQMRICTCHIRKQQCLLPPGHVTVSVLWCIGTASQFGSVGTEWNHAQLGATRVLGSVTWARLNVCTSTFLLHGDLG